VRDRVKRTVDVLIAAPLLVLLSPLLALVALAIRVVLGPPVLFRQERPGRHGTPFTILKFRTMNDRRRATGSLLPDEERLTGLGRFLRRTSFDELPELYNVLRGDMSLVGPRPLLMEYLPLYSSDQRRRHEVRPGITGWAQVNGRNALTWNDKFGLDTWYVEHRGLALDLKILAMTVGKVLRGADIAAPGVATMEPFRGNTSADSADRRPLSSS
jgi:sugar transferase EpsL